MSRLDPSGRHGDSGRRPFRLPLRWRRRVAVFAGGVAGGLARAAIGAQAGDPSPLPWPTLLVNLTGSFLLGYLLVRFLQAARPAALAIPLVCIGVLGAYTTFGQLALELWQGAAAGRWAMVLGYGTATIALGLIAAGLGIRLAGRRP